MFAMFVFVVPGLGIETRSGGEDSVKWTNVCETYFKTSLTFNKNLQKTLNHASGEIWLMFLREIAL